MRVPVHRKPLVRPVVLAVWALLIGAGWHGSVASQTLLPQAPTVRHGEARINLDPTVKAPTLVVDTRAPSSRQTFIDWRSFSIGAGNSVRFDQPDAGSVVVNRVVGVQASQILGDLSSNGQVWLLNPFGVLFGAEARVNVGGLVASTLYANIDAPAQFFSGKPLDLYQDTIEGPAGNITNRGIIQSNSAGPVALISGTSGVLNYGTISSLGGRISLLTGTRVQVNDPGLPNLSFVVDRANFAGAVANTPYVDGSTELPGRSTATLEVSSGRIDIASGIVNQSGIVRADAPGSVGGSISVTAHVITLPDGSVTSASGRQRGGQVRLETVPLPTPQEGYWASLAGRLVVEPKAELRADAIESGKGGLISIQAATAATIDGRLSARGGNAGGDGGTIELGARSLELRQTSVQASSTGGSPGLLSIRSVADTGVADTIEAEPLVAGGSDPPLFYLQPLRETGLLQSRVSSSVIASALSSGTSVELRIERDAKEPGSGSLYLGRGSPMDFESSTPVTIKASHASASPLSLTLSASGELELSRASLLFDGRPVNVHLAAGAAPQLSTGSEPLSTAAATLVGSRVVSSGRITLGGDRVLLASGSYLSSSAIGDAIVLHGQDRQAAAGSPYAIGSMATFWNESGSQALRTSSGRWLIYATTREATRSFIAGGLQHDATYLSSTFSSSASNRYLPASTPQDQGSLLLFRDRAVLTANRLSDTPLERLYDTTRTLDYLGSGHLRGLAAGDRVRGYFADSRAGQGKAISLLDGDGRVQAWDSGGKPVYGYIDEVGTGLVGNILRVPVRLGAVVASSRSYDGTLQTVMQASVAGTVGGETLGAVGSGNFDTANVGTNKPVIGRVALVDGSQGGLASNYVLVNGSVRAVADITPRPLTIAAAVATDKVYDGTSASLTTASLAGLVAGETLTVAAQASFADPHAGAGKLVSGQVTLADGPNGRVSNYSLAAPTFTTTASIQQRPVSVVDVRASDKTYDQTYAASVQVGLQGLVPNEQVQGLATARFDSNQAGLRQARGSVQLSDGPDGSRASNYVLTDANVLSTASILPRSLSAQASADSKVYDGTTEATVSGWRLEGVLQGDRVQVTGSAARFSDAQVGQAKTVVATSSGLTGADAANYRLDSSQSRTQADINPAVLTYVAAPAVRRQGQAIGELGGTVTGFVAGESLSNSTSGQLRFSPRGGQGSGTATQAVDGAGLSAANYRFEQAPSNDTALMILPADPATQSGTAGVRPPARQPLDAGRNLTDLVTALQSNDQQQVHFGALDVVGKPASALAAILDARVQYKRSAFARAHQQLEGDPDLADATPCMTLEQVDTGRCLVTETLQTQYAQATGRPASAVSVLVAAPAPAVAAPAAPVTTAAAAPTTGKAVTLSANVAAAASSLEKQVASGVGPIDLSGDRATTAGLPRPGPAAAVIQSLAKPSPVRAAALPQIQRKLALVIGIDNYADKQIPTLAGARRDAEGVANVLSGVMGYETAVILDGSREAILRRLNRLVLQANPEDSVVIYYAGHGDVVEKTKHGYWTPANANANDPRTWISNNDIGRVISRIPSRQVALISDSCFSGSLVGGPGIATAALSADPLALLRRRAAVVMTSGGNEPVADTGKDGHSVFTYNLMRSLQGLDGWRAGNNVFDAVQRAVTRVLPQRPRYAAVMLGRHETGTDYLFEIRQLAPLSP